MSLKLLQTINDSFWSMPIFIYSRSFSKASFSYIHYDDVIMTTMAAQITSLTVVYSTVYSDANQRKHQSSASLAFVWGIHRDRWIPRTKGQLRGKCFPLMKSSCCYMLLLDGYIARSWLSCREEQRHWLNVSTLTYIFWRYQVSSCLESTQVTHD